ncbi:MULTISPECIES: hypothetical protein [Prochlorococcus]|uniref:hypothetical protein n=1 Tax=Prochlorococcus TaxID=1218 RepID=UPI0005337824|nr:MULTISPECIES: hypothetical protein [Prochlorococcus]KGG12662.1 hypothetical protein EV05_1876 [Prochlorococcus sp. MIT 0601]
MINDFKSIKHKDINDNYVLNLIDFFEKFDAGNPYMRAAISELQDSMPENLLKTKSDWFITWSQAGRR